MAQSNTMIGKRIQELRIAKGLTSADTCKKLGITTERLADIESELSHPPLGLIVNLARILEVPVGEIFGDAADSPFCIVRRDARTAVSRFGSIENEPTGYCYQGLGGQKKDRQMEPFLVTLVPEKEHRVEPNEHIGEEFIFVLEGRVRVTLLDHNDVLQSGDSIYFDSTLAHTVACEGDTHATVLAVIYTKDEMLIL